MRAPVEHLFNDHSFCDSEWCWFKELELASTKLMKLRTENVNGKLIIN